MKDSFIERALVWAANDQYDFHAALELYYALVARLRELRDAEEPRRQDWWDHEAAVDQIFQIEWRIRRDLATELLAMLGEE